ncbi:MAG: hypothetical protein FJ144_17140 [Deltaproteobacteria bacterium]|nr:hypothetical protein [Deltaproteobacteria bacterium]
MSQIKDGGLAMKGRGADRAGIDARIGTLLARRARLLEVLARVDTEIVDLRAKAARAASADESQSGAARWFPLRGEQIGHIAFALPPGLDREDLHRRLEKIVLDERRDGRRVDGLEVLVGFQPASGRVLAVRTRRTGDGAWQPRFEADAAE